MSSKKVYRWKGEHNLICPVCDKVNDACSALEPGDPPKTGDFAICAYCLALNIYQIGKDTATLKKASMEEIKYFAEHEPKRFMNLTRMKQKKYN